MSLRELRAVERDRPIGLARPIVVLAALIALAYYVPTITTSALTPDQVEAQNRKVGWSPAIESDHLAMDIAMRVNEERKARGLMPLVWHDGLADLARYWTEDMMVHGYRHSPREFRVQPDLHGIGENILMGFTDSGDAHVGWMESDAHRRNILVPEYTAIGVAVVCRNDGLLWATQLLGMPTDVFPDGEPETPPVDPIVRGERGIKCG